MPGDARKRSISSASVTRIEFAATLRSPADMDDRFHALAELAVHGANVQPGQVVAVGATIGQEELARAVAEAALPARRALRRRRVLRPVRQARADRARRPRDARRSCRRGTATASSSSRERGDARIALAGVVDPDVFDGLDPALLGRDQLPGLKETARIIGERTTNWTIVPCPHPGWAQARLPGARRGRRATSGSGTSSCTCCGSTSRTRPAAWDERVAALRRSAERADRAPLRRDRAERARHRAHGRPAAASLWWAGDFTTRDGLEHLPNLPTEEVFTTPDPLRDGGPRHLDEAARAEGRHDRARPARALRGRPRGRGRRRRERRRDPRAHRRSTRARVRLGELALVDRQGRIGPLGTIFYDTLLDENAVSHIALGFGFPFAVGRRGPRPRQPERDPHRLHDRLARARRHRRHRRGRARAGAPRRRLADLTATAPARGAPYDCVARSRPDARDAADLGRSTAIEAGGRGRLEPDDAAALHARAARDEGVLAEGGPLVVDTGRPHGPLAEGQVRRPRAGLGGARSGGARSTSRSTRSASTRCARRSSRTSSARDLYVVDAFAGADPGAPARAPRRHRPRLPRAVRADDVHHADRRRSSRASSRRRSSCTRRASRPTRTRTARAAARSSCCTRRAPRC